MQMVCFKIIITYNTNYVVCTDFQTTSNLGVFFFSLCSPRMEASEKMYLHFQQIYIYIYMGWLLENNESVLPLT